MPDDGGWQFGAVVGGCGAWPDLTTACPPGFCGLPGPATRLPPCGRLAFQPGSPPAPLGQEDCFLREPSVAGLAERQAAGLMAGADLRPGRPPVLSSQQLQPGPVFMGRTTSAIRLPRAGLCLLQVLVWALRPWGGRTCLPHPHPSPVPSWWCSEMLQPGTASGRWAFFIYPTC